MILNVSFIGTRYYAAINTNTLRLTQLSSAWACQHYPDPSKMEENRLVLAIVIYSKDLEVLQTLFHNYVLRN